jgi:hypothetical protein
MTGAPFKPPNNAREQMKMDLLGFVVNKDGTIEDGPDGWVGSLSGTKYTVTHNSGVKLVPTLTVIGTPNDDTGNYSTPQLVDVGVDSFSWQNFRNMIGLTTNYATDVRIAVAAV